MILAAVHLMILAAVHLMILVLTFYLPNVKTEKMNWIPNPIVPIVAIPNNTSLRCCI
jgi:hypothetical protein